MIGELLLGIAVVETIVAGVLMWRAQRFATRRYRIDVPDWEPDILSTMNSDHTGLI